MPSDDLRPEDRAVRGTQAFLIITAAPAGTLLVGKKLIEAGALIPGTYECEIDLQGLKELETHLMPSAISGGAYAPSLIVYYENRRKPKVTVAGANFAAGVLQSLVVSGLKGEKVARVTFTVPAAQTLTFDPGAAAVAQSAAPTAQAEFNGA